MNNSSLCRSKIMWVYATGYESPIGSARTAREARPLAGSDCRRRMTELEFKFNSRHPDEGP